MKNTKSSDKLTIGDFPIGTYFYDRSIQGLAYNILVKQYFIRDNTTCVIGVKQPIQYLWDSSHPIRFLSYEEIGPALTYLLDKTNL